MRRNVFLSFLGTTDFIACNYFLSEEKVDNVRFVQEALVKILCKEWSEKDKIFILLTDEARQKNWEDDGHIDKNTGRPLRREGLKKRLLNAGCNAEIVGVDIPVVKNMNDANTLFEIVYKLFEKRDNVYYDITHSFRMSPFLVGSVLNYSSVVKEIKVKGVYYGALEALGPIEKVKNMDLVDRNVPIIDLGYFNILSEWAFGAEEFILNGSAKKISNLVKMGMTENQDLEDLANLLLDFTQNMKFCRCKEIIEVFDYERLFDLLTKDIEEQIKPFHPLLEYLRNNIQDYKNGDMLNGFYAVDWCLKHDLIQQALTILQETVITYIVNEVFGKAYISQLVYRKLVTQAFDLIYQNVPEYKWQYPASEKRVEANNVITFISNNISKLIDPMIELKKLRNDINHCGCLDDRKTPEHLKKELKKYYREIFEVLKNKK